MSAKRSSDVERLGALLAGEGWTGLSRDFSLKHARQLLADVVSCDDGNVGYLRRIHPDCTKAYSDDQVLRLRDELRYVWNPKKVPQSLVSVVGKLEGEHRAGLLPEVIVNSWLRFDRKSNLVIFFDRKGSAQIRPNTNSLPSMLAFSVALHGHHLKFCQNLDCTQPYFIADRLDQKFCSDICAAPSKRAAARRWWRKHKSRESKLI